MRLALGEAWQIDSQLPIALDDDSEPEPDVSVVARDPTAYRHAHPARPMLVVEVAEGSYQIDRHYKLSLYARAGVREYWIVDVSRDGLEVHREPVPSSDAVLGWVYGRVDTLSGSATVTALLAPDRPISVRTLLP